MKRHPLRRIALFMVLASCTTHQVSYRQDIAPVLQSRCVECHSPPDGSGYKETGLRLDSYDAVMEGTIYGPVIVAGDSRRSILNMLVEGRAGPQQRMPHRKAAGLTEQQIKLLSDWVNQGALNN